MKDWLYRFWKYLRTEIQNPRPGIKKDIWKWINRIFFSGIWLQPFAMAGLILFFQKVLGGDVSYLILFVLSFLPSVYVWSENQRQAAAGKKDFSIEDVLHEKPNEFSSPLKQKAMYPRIAEDFLFTSHRAWCLEGQRKDTSKKSRNICASRWMRHIIRMAMYS